MYSYDRFIVSKEGKYTERDASARVVEAMEGSLRNDKVTLEYLVTLNEMLYTWREEVKKAIMNWPDSGKI